MNTIPTHLVINAAIDKKYGRQAGLAKSAFLWGSVLPDLPLLLLSIGFLVYSRYIAVPAASGLMHQAYDDLYFHNPLWIAGHNFLHSPTALVIYTLLLWRFRGQPNSRGHWWLGFVLGCLVHSLIDIFTHYDDGPLLFWPFDWFTRFYSPVSYWDSAHYADQFVYFEVGLNIVLLGYLFLPGLIRRLKKRSGHQS
jgi:membrane-bound metal-dependent hydrolase YbcI (DUF457 family)